MSHIPNSAMPHAGGTAEMERDERGSFRDRAKQRANQAMESARAHPRTTAAAGAAMIAGVAAAAAVPFMLKRKNGKSEKSAGKSKKSG